MTTPYSSARPRRVRWAVACLAVVLLLSACGRNMFDQPRADTFEASPFFEDGAAARPLPEGTVSRERGAIDPVYLTGQDEDGTVSDVPVEVSVDFLRRGQERYNIYCAPCHGYSGEGDGMIVQRGFPQPTSFHQQRLLDAPVGYYFNAITNGFGRMFSYASRVPVEDRWAISAYVKALQLSQNATLDDVPEEALSEFQDDEGTVR